MLYLLLPTRPPPSLPSRAFPHWPRLMYLGARPAVRCIFLALNYLFYNAVLHRDMKPANCLISEDGRTPLLPRTFHSVQTSACGHNDMYVCMYVCMHACMWQTRACGACTATLAADQTVRRPTKPCGPRRPGWPSGGRRPPKAQRALACLLSLLPSVP